MAEARGAGYSGQAGASNTNGRLNSAAFVIKMLFGRLRTAALVRVDAVHGGGTAGIGTVDVTQLVNLIDGIGNSSPASQIFGLPFGRIQGGNNAFICDPAIGDIGLAVFADRDISAVKANSGAQSNPGSRRRHNASDGVYLFSVIAAGPTQYVEFTADGINVTDKHANTIVTSSSGITLTDKNNNTIVMGSSGVTINGVLFDRSRNVSGVKDFTNSGNSNLSGAAQAVKLADNSAATKVKAT
jgi:hypothetical protein